MFRAIVSVGTGSFARGIDRLGAGFKDAAVITDAALITSTMTPPGCPKHQDVPYAFKAYALQEAADMGFTSLLWLDSCMVPGPRSLSDLWAKIERDGYYIGNNGFSNYEWTADSAYPDLFGETTEAARSLNRLIPHVVGGVIGLDMMQPIGRAILSEYFRLAQTKAFCGPWKNGPKYYDNPRQAPCGPPDVRGHRHDQTALSVIAWWLGCKLTNSPEWFAYDPGQTDQTCIVAKGL